MPAGVQDPAVIIPASINLAARAWTNAAMAIVGKNLKICKVGACGGDNHDGGTVTVKTVVATTTDVGLPDTNHSHGCGSSVACVKFGSTSASAGPGRHLGDMSLVVEEPAWECRQIDPTTSACIPAQHVRSYWTDKPRLDNDTVKNLPHGSPPSSYHYIGSLMIHEFGHTLGLPDFYKRNGVNWDERLSNVTAIMNLPTVAKGISLLYDIAQLDAIYARHTRHTP